jgi:hypothetical protein
MHRTGRITGGVALAGLALLVAGSYGSAVGRHHVVLIVEERLAEPLSAAIAQFRADLAREGVTLELVDSLTADTPPPRLRGALQTMARTVSLDGAILVGDFPAILFNQPGQQGDAYWHDHLADLYYMDLDGYWADADSNGVFETHRDRSGEGLDWPWISGGDREPEIWVSRLRTGTLPGIGSELDLLRGYFARNHAYRTARERVEPRLFLVGAGIDLPSSDWGVRPAALYAPSQIDAVVCTDSSSTALRRFLSSGQRYEMGVINVFSGPRIHHFDVHEGEGYDPYWDRWPEGRRAVTEFSADVHAPYDISWKDVAEWQPRVSFYQILSSETGRHDQKNYLGGVYVFTGEGLAAIAGTQHSGAVGTPPLYADLAAGHTIGEAWRRALEYELERAGESARVDWCGAGIAEEPYGVWPAKAVLLGDGTLRLRGGATVVATQ